MYGGLKEGNIRGLLAFKEMLSCLRVLSDASRFRIVHELAARGEMQVSDLALLVKVSQPLLSWHLRKLRRAGLISTRKDGRQVFCSLNRTQIRQCEIMLAELAGADLCEGNQGSTASQLANL